MDDKFQVDLRQYATVTVRCPGCGKKYLLKLRYGHSALAQRANGEVLINCPTCVKTKRLSGQNFEIKSDG